MIQRLKTVAFVSVPALTILGYSLSAQSPTQPVAAPLKNSIGMEFVKIPAGEFTMGCSTGDDRCSADENPRHRVQITKSFEIGKYEVTKAQWMAVMKVNPSGGAADNRPVETVSKLEAQDFMAKLNAMNDGYRYRLPTEAEWEYAARAGRDAPYSGPLDEVAWYSANSEDETHPVGQKRPNAWGLYDMQGNVREWVSDLYSSGYYSISPAVDPTGPVPGAGRGGRGGRGGLPGGPPGGGPPRGGRGGPGGPRAGNTQPPAPPVALQAGATQQEQIDALRQQVDQLQRDLQQLRNEFQAGPPPGGPAILGPGGQLIDALDGLPTGLPVVRGGGWDQSSVFQRVSARYSYYGPTLKVSDIGFRVVREPVAQSQ